MQPRHIRLPSWVGGSTVIFCMVDAYSKSSRLFVSLSITTDLSYLDIKDFSYWIVVVQLDLCPTGKKSQTKVMHQSFLLMISFGGILSRSSRLRGETAIITIANGILLPLTLLAYSYQTTTTTLYSI